MTSEGGSGDNDGTAAEEIAGLGIDEEINIDEDILGEPAASEGGADDKEPEDLRANDTACALCDDGGMHHYIK